MSCDGFECAEGPAAPVGTDAGHAARQFGRLSDRVASHSLDVTLEFMPHTDLPNLASAWRIIKGAARGNGGLCLDSFHLFHAGDTVEAVARLPRAAIKAVQLNDGPLAPFVDYEQAMVSQRVACGDGEFPLRELLDALLNILPNGTPPQRNLETVASEVLLPLAGQGGRYP